MRQYPAETNQYLCPNVDNVHQFLFINDEKKTKILDAVAPIPDSECALRMIEFCLTRGEEGKTCKIMPVQASRFKEKREDNRRARGCAVRPRVRLYNGCAVGVEVFCKRVGQACERNDFFRPA